jgi:hypothetical protein
VQVNLTLAHSKEEPAVVIELLSLAISWIFNLNKDNVSMYLVKFWPLKLCCFKEVNTHTARPERMSFIHTLFGSNPSPGDITEFFYVLPNSRK